MKKIFASLCLLCLPLVCNAAGLATELGEAVLDGLVMGQDYNLRELGLPFTVINTGDEEIELVIEPVIPDSPKQGYEPIPEISWVNISQTSFNLKPKERALSDIIIKIPEDKSHIGKKYQVNIWSHTKEELGAISVGLSSRLLLHIKEEQEIPPKMPETMAFGLIPESLMIKGVKPGYVFEVNVPLIIENKQGVPMDCTLETIRVSSSYISLDEGWEDCPNPGFLILDERDISLKPWERKEVKLYLAFVKDKGYRKKNYLFIVRLKGITIPLALYSKVYVKTK
ncbi:MAG: hypothetical protein AB1630_09210 [bacterium]